MKWTDFKLSVTEYIFCVTWTPLLGQASNTNRYLDILDLPKILWLKRIVKHKRMNVYCFLFEH